MLWFQEAKRRILASMAKQIITKHEAKVKEALKPRARPPGVSLVPWREYTDYDDPHERYSDGVWNRMDYRPRRNI